MSFTLLSSAKDFLIILTLAAIVIRDAMGQRHRQDNTNKNLKTLTLKMEKYDSQVLKNSYPLGKIKYLKNKDDQGIIKLKESKDSLKRIKLSMRINSEHFINYGEVGILDTEIDLNGFEFKLRIFLPF